MLHIDNFKLTVLQMDIIKSNKSGKAIEYIKLVLCDMDKSYDDAHVLTLFDTLTEDYSLLITKIRQCKSPHPVIVCSGQEFEYHTKLNLVSISDVIDREK